jgi:ELWxxDGT repeat protein
MNRSRPKASRNRCVAPPRLESLERRRLLSVELLADIAATPGGAVPTGTVAWRDALYFSATGSDGMGLWTSDGSPGGTRLLHDLKTPQRPAPGRPFQITPAAQRLYFVAESAELWTSDGTAAGTTMLRRFNVGGGKAIDRLTAVGDTLFFVAPDDAGDVELWKSDGTPQGTSRVKDIAGGSSSGNPSELTAFKGLLYFAANGPAGGNELWRSDGTEAGTYMLKDIHPTGASTPAELTVSGGALFFTANAGSGRRLWKTDGTPQGTVQVKGSSPSNRELNPLRLTDVGGTLYFTADATFMGHELWRSDGTDAGTRVVKDIAPGGQGSQFDHLTAAGDTLYFSSYSSSGSGWDVWRSDGTPEGTRMVKDIRVTNASATPANLTPAGDALYFTIDTGLQRAQWWRTDGTEPGTVPVQYPGEAPDFLAQVPGFLYPAVVGETLYFIGPSWGGLQELWKIDPAAARPMPMDALRRGSIASEPENFVVTGDRAFFSAGSQLWVTDGTPAGTSLVKDRFQVDEMTALGGGVLMSGRDAGLPERPSEGYELWSSDGTPAGTRLVKDIRPGTADASPHYFERIGDVAYFAANDGVHGIELWRSDGTDAGTRMFRDINPGPDSSFPQSFFADNGRLYFSADDGQAGQELWVTDGSEQGTTFVDFQPGRGGSQPTVHWSLDGDLIMAAARTDYDHELWRFDPATGQAELLGDLRPGPEGSSPIGGIVRGDLLYVTARPDDYGYELFRTDGTPQGTMRLSNRGSQTSVGYSVGLPIPVPNSDRLLFIATTPQHGPELWTTDGTPTGTNLLLDLRPGPTGSIPSGLTPFNGALYFFADDGVHGTELWKTDGTAAGTSLAHEFVPGPLASKAWHDQAGPIVPLGDKLLVVADDGFTGAELWAFSPDADTTAPAVVSAEYRPDALPPSIRVTFSEHVARSLAADDFHIQNTLTGATVPAGDVAWDYTPSTHTATLWFPQLAAGLLREGAYRLSIAADAVRDIAGNPLAVPFTFGFRHLPADANRDGAVNFTDLVAVAQNYGKTGSTWATGDFNGDTRTDFQDLVLLAQRYNTPPPAASAAVATAAKEQSSTRVFNTAAPIRTTPSKRPAPKARKT